MSLTRPATEFAALIAGLRDFIDQEVIPREDLRSAHDGAAVQRLSAELGLRAQALGFGAPRLAVSEGGLGLSWEECCAFLEEAGRSFLGPAILQCAPPGQPDIAALEQLASPWQRQRYLDPLARGQSRSCFAMTEPAPGAGSDPRMLATTARRQGDGWVLDGHKWFISGAMRADFAIVVARSDNGVCWFLVDTSNPGFQVLRDIPSMEPFDVGGHAEILLKDCQLGPEALIGEEGKGLEYAQLRLEGARLFHCMRFIGLSSRAMDMAQDYAAQRQSHGARLAEHQMVQAMVANAHIDLYAARLMTLDVARRLDLGESIRHTSSMAKVFVSEAVNRVADSAVQITGALGISEDVPLSMILRMLRPFRIYDGASEVHRAAIAKRAFKQRLHA
ncbi:acyl-CoA dehydrogenase family protein [Acidovorax sp. Be4]|uniref:Acyl-CoA dehydrogenase family protein n=1 Tax=Acidovorax bellezanensis TaxID=2976702 RepID=A0ABT2PJL0_9BURK|nr:acyl-CoA dehydrogenase family protein [Acidovorax sp. Be4]MCT9810672.1 acyl-CoA dehydrogenase family protein [Acidovorax sp. Be4]